MTARGPHPAATVPRPQLPPARLLLGAVAAAVGLFVALHWIVLPGDHLSLAQKSRRSESIAARDSATRHGMRQKAAAAHVDGARPPRKQATALEARRQQAAKTAPRTAGKPIGPAPGTKQPGAPTTGAPPASGSDAPAATETPPANQSSPPPSRPPPPPIGLPQLPQLPQLPDVPQVPVPSVPDLPKPQLPGVTTTPRVPSLP
jgi:hypothetical protein